MNNRTHSSDESGYQAAVEWAGVLELPASDEPPRDGAPDERGGSCEDDEPTGVPR